MKTEPATPRPWRRIRTPSGVEFIGNPEAMLCVCLSPEAPLDDAVRSWPMNAALICSAHELVEALEAARVALAVGATDADRQNALELVNAALASAQTPEPWVPA